MEWHIGDRVHTEEMCKEYVVYCDNPILHVIISIKNPFDMQYVMGLLKSGYPPPILCRQTNVGLFNMYDTKNLVVHELFTINDDGNIIKKKINSPYSYAYTKEPDNIPDDILTYKGSNVFNI